VVSCICIHLAVVQRRRKSTEEERLQAFRSLPRKKGRWNIVTYYWLDSRTARRRKLVSLILSHITDEYVIVKLLSLGFLGLSSEGGGATVAPCQSHAHP
jgi:hypothetical protein